MKRTNLILILSICLSLCFINISFAEIDLDLGDDDGPSRNASVKESWVTLIGGYDLGGTGDLDIEADGEEVSSEEGDMESGFSFYFEFGKALNKNVGLGGGACYQLGRGIDEPGFDKGEFNFIPVYGLLKIWFPTPSVIPFGIVHVGYNFFLADDDLFNEDLDRSGGLYWAIGGGVMFDNGVQIELLYSTHNGSLTGEAEGYDPSYGFYTSDIDAQLSYSKVTLAVGINL